MHATGKNIVEEILRHDRDCRRVGENMPLCTLSKLEQKHWDFTLPTLTKGRSYADVRRELSMTVKEFSEKFFWRYPVLKNIAFDKILIAGGSVSSIVLGIDHGETPDVDIFVYGLSPEAASRRAVLIVQQIKANVEELLKLKDSKTGDEVYHAGQFAAFLMMNDDTCTLNIGRTKIQIIFRLYTHLSEILHGFDLGSSAIGFDGKEVYLTDLGKFAYEYGCNIIDTTRRSTSYEKRLVKYFNRGFSIIMPNLDVTKLRTNNNRYRIEEICEIPRFVFAYSSVHNNKITVTQTLLVKGDVYDYAPGEIEEETMVKFNITQLLTRGDEANLYVRTRQLTHKLFSMECYLTDELIELFYREVERSLMPKTFKPGLAEKFITVIPFNELVTKLLIERVDREVFVPDLIQRQISETKAKLREYKARHVRGIKWRTENPGGQGGLLTSSINPIMEAPQDWYGDYFTFEAKVHENILREHAAKLEQQRRDQLRWVIEVDSPAVSISASHSRSAVEIEPAVSVYASPSEDDGPGSDEDSSMTE